MSIGRFCQSGCFKHDHLHVHLTTASSFPSHQANVAVSGYDLTPHASSTQGTSEANQDGTARAKQERQAVDEEQPADSSCDCNQDPAPARWLWLVWIAPSILWIGLCVHSIFEGLAVGLQACPLTSPCHALSKQLIASRAGNDHRAQHLQTNMPAAKAAEISDQAGTAQGHLHDIL